MKNGLLDGRHDANAYRRGESIDVQSRRHRRPEADRARIVAESLEPGAKVSVVARLNGVSRARARYQRRFPGFGREDRVDVCARHDGPRDSRPSH